MALAHVPADLNALSTAVAWLLLSEYALAREIAQGKSAASVPVTDAEREHIIASKLGKGSNGSPYHRDGLLFQLIMWVAATLEAKPEVDLISPPHVRQADKGQDSVIVHADASSVATVTICEDKATENPRDTIHDEVWPEIKKYESGARDSELKAEVHALLLQRRDLDKDAVARLAREVVWARARAYRVRITHDDGAVSRQLFKGYADVAKGGIERRRGEIVPIASLRAWMDDFAALVAAALRSFPTKLVSDV